MIIVRFNNKTKKLMLIKRLIKIYKLKIFNPNKIIKEKKNK